MPSAAGLIRDVLVREEPLLFKPGQFYVIASVFGVTEFTLLTTYVHAPVVPAAVSAIAITFVFRLLGDPLQLENQTGHAATALALN